MFMKLINYNLLMAILILCLAVGLYAQDNKDIENKWGGDAAVGLALARGNTDTTNFSLTFSAKGPLSKSLVNTNKAYFLLSKERDITNAESMGIHSQIKWEHSQRFFSYYEVQGFRDRFKNYTYRILPAAGIGYNVVSTERINLSARAGISPVLTKYYESGETDSYASIAFGNQFTWKISEGAEITQSLDINTNFSELGRYFFHFEVSLASAITKGLSVKLTVMDNYDNKPVGEGIKKSDISFIAGLSAKF